MNPGLHNEAVDLAGDYRKQNAAVAKVGKTAAEISGSRSREVAVITRHAKFGAEHAFFIGNDVLAGFIHARTDFYRQGRNSRSDSSLSLAVENTAARNDLIGTPFPKEQWTLLRPTRCAQRRGHWIVAH